MSQIETKSIRPDISILVPIYNVEHFLVRCLDSIFNQNFTGSIEVIAIDDCSTDNSLKVLQDYQQQKPELIILRHSENRRLAQARSTGMRAATGDYILHVDSDDWLLPDALQILYTKSKAQDADVLVFNYLIQNSEGEQSFPNKIKFDSITEDKLEVQHLFYGGCWTKFSKRKLTQNMVYSEVPAPKSTEDLLFCTELLLRAKKIHVISDVLYGYFKNTQSITNSTKPEGYLSNQILIANNLHQICIQYELAVDFKHNLLDYFEKWIYLAVCKIHFWASDEMSNTLPLFNSIFEVPLLEERRVKLLKKAINNRWFSFKVVLGRFGWRYALGILYRSVQFKK